MFKRLKKFYNEEYTRIAIYVVVTASITFLLGLLLHWASGRVGTTLTFTSAVFKPLVLGLCIAYLLSPLALKFENGLLRNLNKPKTRRIIAVLLTFLIVMAALAVIIVIIVATVTKSLSTINFDDVKSMAMVLVNQFESFQETIKEVLAKLNINVGSFGSYFSKFFSGVSSGASTLAFAVIFSIYFLIDRNIGRYWAGVFNAFTSESTRKRMKRFAADADKVFSGYIRGQSLDAALVGVLASVSLLIAGIPYAVVVGILTGIGNLVPYVGPVVGFGSLIVVCLAEGSIHHLIIGGIILMVVMFIDGNIIGPRMLSSNVEVHPILVILALLAGGRIGGVVGMLVSVPVAGLIKLEFERYMITKKHYDPSSAEEDGAA